MSRKAWLLVEGQGEVEAAGNLVARLGREVGFPIPWTHPLRWKNLHQMGYPVWDGATWESRRGIKEWLSSKLPPGRIYKETVDQLPMTRRIDFQVLRQAMVPSFGSLERAIRFLGDREGTSSVYP